MDSSVTTINASRQTCLKSEIVGRIAKHVVATFICSVTIFVLSPRLNAQQVAEAKRPENVYDKTLGSVVAIMPDIGEDSSIGTGWVLDKRRRLVLTNHHVIEDATDCKVFFPMFKDGELISDVDTTLEESRAVEGKVVDSDFELDLAIVQLRALPPNVKELKISEANASPGQRVHSISGYANGNQGLWNYSTGHVRQRVAGDLANGGTAMLLESDMATNQGNSGGPVVNDAGEVVAVVEGHRVDARLVSIYVDRKSILKYLTDAERVLKPTSANDFLFAAERHANDFRYEEAAKFCSSAIKLEKNPSSLSIRAGYWLDQDELELARADLKEAIAIDPSHGDTLSQMARLAMASGDVTAALKHLNDAIRSEPGKVRFREQRGLVRLEQGNYKGARRDANYVMDNADEWSLAPLMLRSKAEFELRIYDSAAQGFAEVLDYCETDYEAQMYLGKIGVLHKQYADAETLFKAAIENDIYDMDPSAHLELIQLYLQLKMPKDAYVIAERLVKRHPECAEGWSEYAVLIYGSDPKLAINNLQYALRLAPENQEIKRRLEKLSADHQKNQSTEAIVEE